MTKDNIMDVYDYIKDDLKFITTSSVRTKVILSLKETDLTLNQIKDKLALKSSSISHAIKNLEEENLVVKDGKNYSLSSLGKFYLFKSENLFKSFSTVKNCEKIFLNHLIDGIPHFLIEKIGYLNDSYIVESTPLDLIKPHTHYMEILSKSKDIRIISPIFYYPFFDLYTSGLKEGARAEIIITPLILNAMIKNMGREKIKEAMSTNKLQFLLVDEDMNISFAVTEDFLHFGLFLTDGIYDATMSLVNYNADAVKWGEELYNFYLKNAKEIDHKNI